jgi:hypothetical protein
MATIVSPPYNTGSTSVTGGTGYPGDAATGLGQRQFIDYVNALQPYETPFLSSLGRGPVIHQPKFEWGVKTQLPYTVQLDGAMTNTQTTMTVDAGHGSRLQKGMVLYIPADGTNAAEIAWIDNDAGTLTSTGVTAGLVRGQGGTSGVAHLDNTVVYVIGVAIPENDDHTLAPYIFGDLYYNYPERFSKKVSVDLRQDATPNWEDPDAGIFESRLQTAAKDAKINLEMALLWSQRQAEVYDGSAQRPSLMSGLNHFITLSGNTFDLNDGLITPYAVQTAVKDRWDDVAENVGDTFLMSMLGKMCWDTTLNIKRRLTANDTSVDLRTERVRLSTGVVNIETTRRMNGIGDDIVFFYRKSDLKLHNYEGLDWHFRRKVAGVDTDGDYVAGSVSGDFSFSFLAPNTAGKIYNFATDIDQYPSELSA